MIYDWIVKQGLNGKKIFALLLDPDEYNDQSLRHTLIEAGKSETDLILVGGSLVTNPVAPFIQKIKENSEIPVLLFPGNLLQISNNADGILFLSLISTHICDVRALYTLQALKTTVNRWSGM